MSSFGQIEENITNIIIEAVLKIVIKKQKNKKIHELKPAQISDCVS